MAPPRGRRASLTPLIAVSPPVPPLAQEEIGICTDEENNVDIKDFDA